MKLSKHTSIKSLAVAASMLACQATQASTIDQYASSVIAFSSQWSTGGWSATQVLGTFDTFGYGDIPTSWAPYPKNGSHEFITVGFTTAVYANGATIRETYGNGFVTQIDAIDNNDVYHTVWNGTDNSLPGSPVDFLASWSLTNYLVKGLKIYTDTNHDLSAWEEIDSIQLHGDTTAPVPVPGSVWLFGSSLLALAARKRKLS